jgi:hypothetical protein
MRQWCAIVAHKIEEGEEREREYGDVPVRFGDRHLDL